jgi:hypothetical protein
MILQYNIHKAKTIITNKVLMTHEIINRLDELYSNYLVYRTIIVCDNNNLGKYDNILRGNNYDTYALKEYDAAIDYDSLDIRIFLIEKRDFIKFISEYIDNVNVNGIDKVYFYNSIIIQFDNGNDNDIIGEADRIKREYYKLSNNNNEIII